MIEGLKVTVAGSEVQTLCLARADALKVKAQSAREDGERIREHAIGAANRTGGDPIQALIDKAQEYENEASELRFIAAHVSPGESYLLKDDDLEKLGVVRRRW